MTARPGPQWFWAEHDAAESLCGRLKNARPLGVVGAAVAHVGSADGARSLGIHACGAASVLGFEEATTDRERLHAIAGDAGLPRLPKRLRFLPIIPAGLPVDPDCFDVAIFDSLSRVRRVVPLLQEVRRVLRPNGVALFEVRPLYSSAHGAGLPAGIAEPFEHLLDAAGLAEQLPTRVADEAHAAALLDRLSRANRLTVEQLHQSLLIAGFELLEVHLETDDIEIPTVLQHRALGELATSAVTVIARPRRRTAEEMTPATA